MIQIWHRNADQPPTPESEPIGIIDIGSNSVRLVVYDGALRAPTPLFNEKVLCGLGREVATTGQLGTEAVERALSALTRFHGIANVLGIKLQKGIATAAVREAKNGAEFLARGEQAARCKIEVLSGQTEARLAAQGIMMGFIAPDGIAGDLGGGSLELTDLVGEDLREAATLPLGGLRLIDMTGGKLEKAIDIVDAAISELPWVKQGAGRTFFPVGGTWRALAKMHMEANNYPLRVMHGYTLSTRDTLAQAEAIRKAKKWTDLPGSSAVAKARRESLPFGALVLERLLLQMQPANVVFSVFGIREGYIYGVLPPTERARDPLLSFCEGLATVKSRSIAHARELCAWTDGLFEADGGCDESDEERRQRYAACLLSDIGWRGHPDYRGEQSMMTVAHSGLTGVDHEGRVFLALTLYFRHETNEDRPDPFFNGLKGMVSKRVLRRARIVGAAVRTAHMLSIGHAGVIDSTSLKYDGADVVLTLPREYAELDGERLRRRFETLAQLVGKTARVVVET